jgi:AraC-like DNA-binding protein
MTQFRAAIQEDNRPALLPFAGYRSAVAEAVVALNLTTEHPEGFRGVLTGRTSGAMQVLAITATAHSVHRTPSLIGGNPEHYVKFTVVEQGSGMIIQDGRESHLQAGDMTVYDTDRPYSLICTEDVQMSIIMFPKTMLEMPGAVIARATATRVDGASGIGAMVRPYLTSLAQQMDNLETHALHRLSRNALDLVSTLLEAHCGPTAVTSTHETLLTHVLEYIDDHLGEADLNPAKIAAAHFVSVRYLHLLFSDQGTTVSTVIRNRRLERCYDALIDPLHTQRSVTSIALDNGFVDPAHFSRTFRTHFGVSPSTLRPRRP